jgi:hypothetical protein
MHGIPTWLWVIVALAAGPKVFYVLQAGRRRKAHLRFRVRRATVCLSFYFGGFLLLMGLGYRPVECVAFAFVLGIAAGFFFVPRPNRSRVIPKHVRRAVIERDLKGVQFDSTIHHIDHIVPYSKGGDHSVANLRVIPKVENLRRGARPPELRDFIFTKRRS